MLSRGSPGRTMGMEQANITMMDLRVRSLMKIHPLIRLGLRTTGLLVYRTRHCSGIRLRIRPFPTLRNRLSIHGTSPLTQGLITMSRPRTSTVRRVHRLTVLHHHMLLIRKDLRMTLGPIITHIRRLQGYRIPTCLGRRITMEVPHQVRASVFSVWRIIAHKIYFIYRTTLS